MEENTPASSLINQPPVQPAQPLPPQPPVQPAQPMTPPVAPVAPAAKGSKLPLIIGACVAVAAIGGCAAYATVKNQPTNVALDAISNFMQQDKIAVSGNFSVTFPDEALEDMGVKSLSIILDEKASGANAIAEAMMTITTKDDSFKLDIGEGYIENGKLYIKVSGLKEALEQESFEEAIGIAAFFENTLEKLDGTWWEIDIPTIVDSFSDSIDEEDRTKIKTAYQCVVDKIKTTDSKEFTELYKANQFVNAEKYTGDLTTPANGGKLYQVSLDSGKLKSFVDGASNTNLASGLRDCVKDFNTDEISTDTSEFDATEITDHLPTVLIETTGFLNHSLRRVYISGQLESENEYGGDPIKADFYSDLVITYPKDLTVTAPEGAKPVKEIVESAMEELQALLELESSLDGDTSLEDNCDPTLDTNCIVTKDDAAGI